MARTVSLAPIWALALTIAPAIPATAQQVDARAVTGSVYPATRLDRSGIAAPTTNPVQTGSASFESALQHLDDGDAVAAYSAGGRLSDPAERRAVQWAAVRFGKGLDADTIARFSADAPHFDTDSLYRSRIEAALDFDAVSGADVIRLLGGSMPQTLEGQLALAEAYVADGQRDRAARIARWVWVENFLNAEGEAEVLARVGGLLTQQDHWDRAVHLLMHDRATGTERIMDRLTPAQKSLAQARIAVSRKHNTIQSLLDRVDPSLRDHSLFHFAVAQWRRDAGDLSGAVDALDRVIRGDVPDAAEFWYERRLIVRRALADNNTALAYRAAANYTNGPEGRVVDAQFHAGWIAMSFLKDPARAKTHFEQMARLSTLPDTITQSRYWLGSAEAALGNTAAAKAHYEQAARFGSLYYGQLAREAMGQAAVSVRSLPDWQSREAAFEQLELVRAVRLLVAAGERGKAETLVGRLAYSVSDQGDFVLAARLAQDVGAHNVAILIADIADRRGFALDLFHFPKDGIPKGAKLAKVDSAAVYAVARQESRFDVDAVSRAGARGLMQLMPGTARDVAKRVGVGYSAERLVTDASYNLLLGSTYLASQLERYDNSLLLAAAAYNGGAGNVNKWIAAYGDPRQPNIDPIDWIELIPFVETRKYVQKVLANYLVYRARLGDQSLTMEQALRRIPA